MLLQEMEMFYYVVSLGSFSQAADKLAISKAHVSRSISKLEAALRTQLLFRSTRSLSLTEAGKTFFQHCKNLIVEAEEGVIALSQLHDMPSGNLHIAAPPAFGNILLAKFLPSFLSRYPEIKLTINLDSNITDILNGGIDVAIRAGHLADSQLIAQKLNDIDNILCATPHYLQQFGSPIQPTDLKQHRLCVYQSQPKEQIWTFHKGKKTEQITLSHYICANQVLFLKQMVLAGSGIGSFSPFIIEEELKAGKLVHCLADYTLAHSELYLVYASRKFLPLKTQVFIKELKLFLAK